MPEIAEGPAEGSIVLIAGVGMRGILNTEGFYGTVVKVHDAVEYTHCVEFYISRIYKPCFWYHSSRLLEQEHKVIPIGDHTISDRMGMRRVALTYSTIALGCLRSWMHARVKPAAGHHLEELIKSMEFDELVRIYTNTTDVFYAEWVAENDMRPKRARINLEGGAEIKTISIRRPKMGGT